MITLLEILRGNAENLEELIDIRRLPQKLLEVEKKYSVTYDGQDNVDKIFMKILNRVSEIIDGSNLHLERLVNFSGVDQYFILKRRERIFTFRYRVGANRLPQLTVKIADEREHSRGEVNLDVRHEKPEIIRTFISIIANMADSYKLFTIQQSGIIWFIKDTIHKLPLEIVVYKVERLNPPSETQCFLELESLDNSILTESLALIKDYEEKLGLQECECKKSIGEIFAPEESFRVL